MLTEQTLQAAYPLAANLDDRGIAVRPIAGTILATLVDACGDMTQLHYKNNGEVEVDPAHIAKFVNEPSPVTGYCAHTLDLEEVVDVVANAVISHLNIAKTQVIPTIEDLVGRVAPQLEAASRTSMSDFDVEIFNLPAPMLEPALIDSAMRAKDIANDSFVPNLKLAMQVDADIVGFMKSGAATLDASIDSFVASLAPGFLENTWLNIFTVKGQPVPTGDLFDRSIEGLNRAIIAFLVTRRIWDKPPEDTDMSKLRYEEEMVKVRDQAALRLIRELDSVESTAKSGLMIRALTRKRVQVNGPVYKDWINSGGSNEILFGNMMLNKPGYTIPDIMAVQEDARAAWKAFTATNRTVEANKRFAACKGIVRTEFAAILREATEELVPLQERQLVHQRFEEALDKTCEADVSDVYAWVQRLVCNSIFHRTDAGVILDAICRIKAQSPELDVAEAANIASLEYVGRWIANQFEVVATVR